jgi:hypothetical protein
MLTPETTDRRDPLRRVRFNRADRTWTAAYGDHIVQSGCARPTEAEQALDKSVYAHLRRHHTLPVAEEAGVTLNEEALGVSRLADHAAMTTHPRDDTPTAANDAHAVPLR